MFLRCSWEQKTWLRMFFENKNLGKLDSIWECSWEQKSWKTWLRIFLRTKVLENLIANFLENVLENRSWGFWNLDGEYCEDFFSCAKMFLRMFLRTKILKNLMENVLENKILPWKCFKNVSKCFSCFGNSRELVSLWEYSREHVFIQ